LLKKFNYLGVRRDSEMTIDVVMRNPLEFGLDSTTLVLDILVKPKLLGTYTLPFDDFRFYLMDENDDLYNTRSKTHADLGVVADTEHIEDSSRISRGLILTELKHEYLYQDMRLLFYYEPNKKFGIIKLEQG
jgi:hypothetical protein